VLTLVNFPSVRPSNKTPFTLYTRDPGSSQEITKQHTILAGETEDVEFFSTNRDRQGGSEGGDCQYLPAIYNPETGSLEVYASTPLYLLGHRVKRLRHAGLTSQASRAADYRAKRNTLGETFGTKKAKSQIRAEERNKVDVSAMESIKGHLMEAIGESEEVTDTVISDLIPQPNMETTEPALVYPREALIPDAEWSAIDASGLLKAKDDRARAAMLPWRRSKFVEEKMRLAVGSAFSTAAKKSTV
jgi:DNA-directed RNA polymerase I subunit RPA49